MGVWLGGGGEAFWVGKVEQGEDQAREEIGFSAGLHILTRTWELGTGFLYLSELNSWCRSEKPHGVAGAFLGVKGKISLTLR